MSVSAVAVDTSVHPLLAEEPGWEIKNGEYVRKLVAAESVLDQVSQLLDGHDELTFGVSINTVGSFNVFKERLLRALVHLRYSAPLVAASLQSGRHDPQLRSWVYTPASRLEQVRSWAERTLKIANVHWEKTVDSYMQHVASSALKNSQVEGLDQHFYCHLVVSDSTPRAIVLHGSHALLDAASSLPLFKTILKWISQGCDVESLKWGEEVKNLPLGYVTALGGPLPGWDTLGVPLMAQCGAVFAEPTLTHSLKPARQEITVKGRSVRASRKVSKETTMKLLTVAKKLGFSMTQLFDAAFALATYYYNPDISGDASKALIKMFPAIISTRHLVKPLYPGYDFDTLLSIYDVGFPMLIRYQPILSEHKDLKQQMIAVTTLVKSQYARFMGNPQHIYTEAVEAADTPFREPGEEPNPFWGEITNLGVIERRLQVVWPSKDGAENQDTMPVEVSDVHLVLRQATRRPMVHVWTFDSEIRIQVLSSDVWDEDYLGGFLDEIVRCSLSLIDED